MSNTTVFDPLLVHYLAHELDQRLRGRACAAAPLFTAERTITLPLQGGEALQLDLHPRRGWIRIVPWEEESDELDAVCLGVSAPPDERRIEVHLQTADRFRVEARRLVVELHTNQWNALLVSAEESRILATAWSRTAGGRAVRSGQPYEPPAARARLGAAGVSEGVAWEAWSEMIGGIAPEERSKALIGHFAYTGSINAGPILDLAAPEGGPAAIRAAFARWWALRSLPAARPVLLRTRGGWMPYPLPLPGVESEPVASLLAGMERAAAEEAPREAGTELSGVLAQIERRIAAAERRISRLAEQASESGAVERLRTLGDLLLANFRVAKRGDAAVELMGWDGEPVAVALDPALSVAENAARYYDQARRRERAEAQLPALLGAAEADLARWRGAAEAVRWEGRVPEWAERALERTQGRGDAAGGDQKESSPYRIYRTSGGIEVRVGRSSRENDRLTFGHSSPKDIWLHARSVPGSHVVLRWSDPEGAPPARDLEEAAGLAAWFSKARSSALVPVDFTRRKYVRKPRGAPPGSVVVQRAKTLFVEPDAALEERLRAD